MSNYIRALKRLEEDAPRRTTAARPAAPVVERAGPAESKSVPTARREAAPTVAPRFPVAIQPPVGSPALQEFGALFDALEHVAKGRDRCTVVFAPVSHRESTGRLMAGLAAHAEQRRRRAFLAELRAAADRSTLLPRTAPRGDEAADRIEVDTARDGAGSLLRDWLDAQGRDATFVFVEAPPLSESQDAIVLASACDGIVLVAEAEITDRTALQGAAERVGSSDCRTLGVAMIGSSDPMPPWLRRLLTPARSAT